MEPLTPAQLKQARTQIAAENGRKGGPARAASLTPRRRKQIAKKAAQARWGKRTDETR